MKFCSDCAHDLELKIPKDDTFLRYCCTNCNRVFYQNPAVVVGCMPIYEDKVLLCKRAIEPKKGLWTLPAGFMENGECVEEGAIRETFEEAYANVEIESLFTVFSVTNVNYVYMLFKAKLLDLNFKSGVESLEVKLFSKDEIPWDNLAFASIKHCLNLYFNEEIKQDNKTRLGSFKLDKDKTKN
ncbi:MAG: NUDIX hydrolase [Candidatus Cloacimonadota bacterium]|nr:MAG: NUDIX hydrolase [Candidatus Cloacimonadota bacterium]